MQDCFTREAQASVPITLVVQADFSSWLEKQPHITRKWLTDTQFRGEAGNVALLPDTEGNLQRVVACITALDYFWNVGHLPFALPFGVYHFENMEKCYARLATAWGLGAYQFTRYKNPQRKSAVLSLPASVNAVDIAHQVDALYLVRDWVNTPTDDMGPTEFAQEVEGIAQKFRARLKQIVGNELLAQGYPAIHTVGRASDDQPRLLDLIWGDENHPKVTLVGKGVCFDTGGLDIKPSSAMLLMKKDMAGAAHVLGLACMIMAAKLPIRLRVLMPVVENVISGNAYRPGDIIKSRKGLTIEVGNTDAEGRVILADALAEAVSESPELLIDITTLTGAARIALGTDLPALFANTDSVAEAVIQYGEKEGDPLWRLPLFSLYREYLNSSIADINNNSSESYGGAITAALFLKEFVPDTIPWLHIDMMAWNIRSRPGRPYGAEAMALRALYRYLAERYKA